MGIVALHATLSGGLIGVGAQNMKRIKGLTSINRTRASQPARVPDHEQNLKKKGGCPHWNQPDLTPRSGGVWWDNSETGPVSRRQREGVVRVKNRQGDPTSKKSSRASGNKKNGPTEVIHGKTMEKSTESAVNRDGGRAGEGKQSSF